MQHWITNVLAGGLAYPKTLPLHRCKGEVFHLKALSLSLAFAHTYENHRGWFLKAWNDYGISHFLITVNVFNMAAFTTYCRFQSAPDQRIRNVWDNVLQFRRLMAQLFIKADRGKDKNTSREQNRTVRQRHRGQHSCEREVLLPRVLPVAATSWPHVSIHDNISEVTLPWAKCKQDKIQKKPREHVWKYR